MQWYQRFTWHHCSRVNHLVLSEAEGTAVAHSDFPDVSQGLMVEMQDVGVAAEPLTAAADTLSTTGETGLEDAHDTTHDSLADFTRSTQDLMAASSQQLTRCLTSWEILGYGIASTVGSGIYVVTGSVAHVTGPAIIVSFLIAAFAALLSALAYAEFAARVPLSGSAYTFAYVTLGELAAWFIGSNLTLEYSISCTFSRQFFSPWAFVCLFF
jgi:hypothetical protein